VIATVPARLIALICTLAGSAFAEAKRLNVLFVIADDQNCALGCYGNQVVHTPNIDRLASQGVRFDRSYCNYPICNASRVSFLSGRRPDTTKVFGNGTQPRIALGKEFQFLPEYFHANGYYTAGIGKVAHEAFQDSVKWDLCVDPKHTVDPDPDENPGAKTPDTKTEPPKKKSKKQKRREKEAKAAAGIVEERVKVPLKWRATDNKDEDEPDGVTARKVAKLLEEHKDGPFFIAAGFHKPHLSHTAPKKYFDMYPTEKVSAPVEPAGHTRDIPRVANPPVYYPGLSDLQNRSMIAHYYAASTFMDSQVGVVFDAMDKLKLWDNTVVIFIGDHGWHLGEHDGFWAKMSIMEESARAPLIIAAPGHKPNQACARLVEFVDIFPSLCELAGLAQPAGLEGTSFVPLLDDPQRTWKRAAFCVVSRGGAKDLSKLGHSVRTERFTYNEWFDGSMQLYDHDSDAKEYANLAHDERHAKTVEEMKQLLRDGWRAAASPTR
jgi:iduronate 2-sulfatase